MGNIGLEESILTVFVQRIGVYKVPNNSLVFMMFMLIA